MFEAETTGAQAGLVDAFFARDVDGGLAGFRDGCQGLHQQGRLADAWVTADEQG
jgi:hypothetical protein